jgi:putative glutamine amidotransferase
MRSIIGITGNYDREERSFWVRDYYVQSLEEVGVTALVLPPTQETDIINNYLQICDGLLFSGGGDVDPVHWGENARLGLGQINPLRDAFELELARQALKADVPVLGICRGCQVLNVAAGGSLLQDIQSHLLHDQNAPRDYPIHAIVVEKGSLLQKVLDCQEIRVNSFHHQAVKDPGRGFKICARAPDGVIEAIESTKHHWVLGVQWHPECMTDEFSQRLFYALAKASQ